MITFEQELLLAAIFWSIVLGALFVYVLRKKHPNRSLLLSYPKFLGIIFGVLIFTYIVARSVVNLLVPGKDLGWLVGGFLVVSVIIPAWRWALSEIQDDPTSSETEKPPPDSDLQQ